MSLIVTFNISVPIVRDQRLKVLWSPVQVAVRSSKQVKFQYLLPTGPSAHNPPLFGLGRAEGRY